MAQNIYDNQDFFQSYGTLPRSIKGLDGAAEWPTMKNLVGNVQSKDVIDLGCGMGWFCRWAREEGAKSVLGTDISNNMLGKAQSFDEPISPKTNQGVISYEYKDLETIALPTEVYDIVYSSLAFHYLPSVDTLFVSIFKSLRPGGRFVFSIEHPIMTAPHGLAFDGAYKRDERGDVFWPLNSYSNEGLRETQWLGSKGVRKYHRTVETYLNAMIRSGFVLSAVRESWDGMNRSPQLIEEDWGGHRPFLLIVAAEKIGRRPDA
jgi:SAM-dependent methyltransferase